MKDLIIDFLFRLLGNSNTRLHDVQYLFGVSTTSHKARQRRWEQSLMRLWKDKDMLDYLYYQSESDKEKVFKGKLNKDLLRGARIRTLYLVYAAHRAYEETIKRSNAQERGEKDTAIKELTRIYKKLVDVEN